LYKDAILRGYVFFFGSVSGATLQRLVVRQVA